MHTDIIISIVYVFTMDRKVIGCNVSILTIIITPSLICSDLHYLNLALLTGIVDASRSLFTYTPGESWATYYDRNFLPSYDPVFLNSTLRSRAMHACDNDQFCLYDIAATGRMEIGLSTLDGSRNFNKIVNLSYPRDRKSVV